MPIKMFGIGMSEIAKLLL